MNTIKTTRNLPGDSSLPTVLTRDQAIYQWETYILPGIQMEFEQDGERDIPARSESFSNWTDGLCKSGEISEWQYMNWTHPASCD